MIQTASHHQRFNILREITDRFPLKCKLFLNLLLSHLPQGQHIQTPKDFRKAYSPFTHVFSKFSNEQKLYFAGQLSDHVTSCLHHGKNGTTNIVHSIQTSCEIKTTVVGITCWEKRTFKYDYQLQRIRLLSSKKDDILDLRAYLARKSSSEKDSMVLEAVQKTITEKMSKVTLRFKNASIFQQIYSNIRRGVLELSQKKIQDLLTQDMKQNHIQKMNQSNLYQKGFTILTTKNMTQYFNKKLKLTEKIHKNRINASMLCNKNNTRIYRSHQNKKYYYLEQNIVKSQPLTVVKENISLLTIKSVPNKVLVQSLEVFSQNITANYYKLDVGIKEYEFLVITEKVQKEGYVQHTMRAATQFFLDISIEFIIATLKKTVDNQYSFQLSIILNHHSKKSSINGDIINLLLAMAHPNDQIHHRTSLKSIPGSIAAQNASVIQIQQFSNLESFNPNKSAQQINNEFQQNLTVSSGKKDTSQSFEQQQKDQEQRFYSIIIDEEEGDIQIFESLEQQLAKNENNKTIEKTEPTVTQDITFLKMNSFNTPMPLSKLKLLTEHFLFGEWRRSSKGGMVCANEDVIREQKRILKLVFTRIGNNIFKGNSCMNVSLPIQLFRNQSFLVSIGRNLTYAPLLVEPSVSYEPVQRMKHLAIFQISLNALALSVRKPFNPILGETYQGEIAGCPLFLEQISHHPPVTSLYFVGRGYKIYGTMSIDVNLRLNYVRGVNHCDLTLQYDNGDKIYFDLPDMIINALIFGERTIYWEGTVHIIDQNNLLITEITYNSINSKKGLFSFKSQSPDYLGGQIYKVTPDFMVKFLESKHKPSLKKDQANKVISKINGQWNSKIFIDNKQAFDFQQQLPVELQNHSCPLPSDSVLRTDIIQLRKGDLNISQDEKDRLQELQRRDRKLRQTHKPSSSKK